MQTATSRTAAGRTGLSALAADPGSGLVAVDFDGTLAPIVPDPASSRMVEGGHDALLALARTGCRIAVITGRAAATVVELGDLADIPGLVIEGQYGAERWEAGRLQTPAPLPGVAAARTGLVRLLADADPGTWVEDKNLSLVVHTRRAQDPVAELDRLRPALVEFAGAHGLEANAGRNVLELRPPGIDKGGALRRVVAELAPAAVLFAGDDVGDIAAFEAVHRLRQDGLPGVTVCSRSAEAPEVADHADIVVEGPAGVVELITALAGG